MLKEYLESIRDLTPEKNELTHRLFLHNLLDKLKNHFKIRSLRLNMSLTETNKGVSLISAFLFKGLASAI
ncbi:hypothetical protein HpNP92_07360 [Helicobacter pylori]